LEYTKLTAALLAMALLLPQLTFAVKERLDPAVAESLAQATDDPFEKADHYTDAWLDQKAIKALEMSGKKDAGTLWRLARARINIGENIEGDAALPYYEQAMNEAQTAVDLNPNNADAQQTLAIACGRVALFKGVFKSLGLVKRVHEAALKAVALDDSMQIALFVLGRTHKKLIEKPGILRKPLGIGWAKEDSVAYYFEKALEVSEGNMIQCRVEYAEFLLDTVNDKTKARVMLKAALALPLRDEQDAKAKRRAEELMKEL
jgi:tetratricopeptide (TPR) repeat protein